MPNSPTSNAAESGHRGRFKMNKKFDIRSPPEDSHSLFGRVYVYYIFGPYNLSKIQCDAWYIIHFSNATDIYFSLLDAMSIFI